MKIHPRASLDIRGNGKVTRVADGDPRQFYSAKRQSTPECSVDRRHIALHGHKAHFVSGN